MKIYLIILLACVISKLAIAQSNDSLPYVMFKNRVVLYSDLGFNGAPFSIHDNFIGGYDKVQFKHNLKPTMGLGVMYKWFALRVGFGLPGDLRPKSRYGKSSYTDLGINFNIKRVYTDIDLRNYGGFVVKNAYNWNDTLNELIPNDFRPDTRVFSVSANVWYFKSKTFRMPAVIGKVGYYKGKEKSWYFKSTLNLFGVGNGSDPIVPDDLIDSTQNISSANAVSALDIGLVPGYAFVNRYDNWQVSLFGGIGGVVQAKFFQSGAITRGFLGLAPRLDLRFIAGITEPSYFFWFVTNFDIKSIKFKEVRYNQTYYSLKLVGGVRLKKKDKKEYAETTL
ncbi:MAG: hypothetical protein ACI865_002484 [Flavobacteriaceae bacterium]|jgi:hypothetical protein